MYSNLCQVFPMLFIAFIKIPNTFRKYSNINKNTKQSKHKVFRKTDHASFSGFDYCWIRSLHRLVIQKNENNAEVVRELRVNASTTYTDS